MAINRKRRTPIRRCSSISWPGTASAICNQYLKKGMSALVEGRLVVRKHDDKDDD